MPSDEDVFVSLDVGKIKFTVAPDEEIIVKTTPDVVILAAGNIGPQGEDGAPGPPGTVGPQGPQGPTGANSTVPGPPGATGSAGPQGPTGPTGAQGATGSGVPTGGATGQVLTKASPADFSTQWQSGSADLSPAPILAPTTDVRNRYNGDTPSRVIIASGLLTDTVPRLAVRADGQIYWGDGGAGQDVRLYRSFAGGLATDTKFLVGQDLYVDTGGTGAKLLFGSAADVNLFRVAAGILRTDQNFRAGLDLYAQYGLGQQVRIGNNSGNASIDFGSAFDTNLYRQAAGVLATSGGFFLNGMLQTNQNAAGGIALYVPNLAPDGFILVVKKASDTGWRYVMDGNGSMNWGPGAGATDTFLYRAGANALKTPGTFYVGAGVVVDADGAGNRLYFGSALDSSLYRVAASALKTDGDLQIGGKITGNGAVPPGGTIGQALVKKTAADFDIQWVTPAAGGGGGGASNELAYAEIVADSAGITAITEVAATSFIVSPSFVYDGSPVILSFYIEAWKSSSASVPGNLVLWDDTANVSLGLLSKLRTYGANNEMNAVSVSRKLTPAAGARVYSVRAYSDSAATLTFLAGTGGAGQRLPGFIRVTKDPLIGPQGPAGPPGGASAPSNELDYAQIVVDSAAVSALTEATAVAVITGNLITCDGSKLKLELDCHYVQTTAANPIGVVFYRDGTPIGQIQPKPGGSNTVCPLSYSIFDTPSPGSHTYSVRLFIATSGTVTMKAGTGGAGQLPPSFLRVTKDIAIGPQGVQGIPGVNNVLRYRKLTQKLVTSTISPTDLLNGEISIAANVMGLNGMLRLTMWGDAKQNSGAAVVSPRYQVYFGATLIFDTGATVNSNWDNQAGRGSWKIVLDILNLGAANSQMVYLDIEQSHPRVSGTGLPITFVVGNGAWGTTNINAPGWFFGKAVNVAAEDTTTAKALTVNVIHPSNSSLIETKLFAAVAEVMT